MSNFGGAKVEMCCIPVAYPDTTLMLDQTVALDLGRD